MSSLPQTSSSNFLSIPSANDITTSTTTNKRSHRHRRSAAISGDFDVLGNGLFAMPPIQPPQSSIPKSEFIDNVYQFNNDEDFEPIKRPLPSSTTIPSSSSPSSDSFSFPATRTPDLDSSSNSFTRNIPFSPKRYQHPGMHYGSPSQHHHPHMSPGSLNSPIRLSLANHKRAYSSNNSLRPMKLAEEEVLSSSSDIPDPIIDLDEILTANLHIGGGSGSNTNLNNTLHKRTGSAPAECVFDDHEFLASPFLKQTPLISSPFFTTTVGSPLATATSSSVLINQPIHEKPNDDDDDDDDDSNSSDNADIERVVDEDNHIDFLSLENQTSNNSSTTEFPNPPNSLYITLSANSSSSSIRQNLMEKTLSNSSKESIGNSIPPNNNNNNTTTTSSTTNGQNKRSGAKATRYQIFYDQSNRISNALKISSSESVNIIRSNSQNKDINSINSINNNNNNKHLLGHASSFPSLKSNVKRSVSLMPPPPPLPSQYRISNNNGVPKRTISPPNRNTFESQSSISPSNSIKKINSNPIVVTEEQPQPPSEPQQPQPQPQSHNLGQEIIISKTSTSSTSPISIRSVVSSTVISSSGTLLSTDNSSLHSSHIPHKDGSTPSIMVGSETSSSSSTNSTYKQDDNSGIIINDDTTMINNSHNDDTFILPDDNSTILKSPSSRGGGGGSTPKQPSPRRPVTLGEEKILRLTQIPTFKGPSSSISSAPVSPPITSPTISSPSRPTTKTTISSESKQSKRSSFYSRMKRTSMTLSLSDFSDLLPPPPSSNSNTMTGPSSPSPPRQHHKSKSLSLSFQEFVSSSSSSSRPSSTAIISSSSESLNIVNSPSMRKRERRKSNKFMSWFRKKSDVA
ncbi:hypothetical protein DFJ63DRAFT_313862 [Scheffersomyces coipomensis]|uniref:uncharacterized protein n=1 Tax=Scheffersomyces coipomensis TaxID=1788519 RepID=UPI00315C739D